MKKLSALFIVFTLFILFVSCSSGKDDLPLVDVDGVEGDKGSDLDPQDISDTESADTGDTEPADTGDSEPADTGDTEPADTGDSEPADTGDTEPADTGDTEPADTGDSEPADTGDSAPADTGDSEPADTGDSAPADTGDTEPADTGDTEPADTGDSEPADTGDSEPADTGDTEPADTGDTEPADTGDTEPADTGDSAPSDTGDTESTDTGDSDPADTGDSDPADTGDSDPADTGDSDPADTGDSDSTEITDPTACGRINLSLSVFKIFFEGETIDFEDSGMLTDGFLASGKLGSGDFIPASADTHKSFYYAYLTSLNGSQYINVEQRYVSSYDDNPTDELVVKITLPADANVGETDAGIGRSDILLTVYNMNWATGKVSCYHAVAYGKLNIQHLTMPGTMTGNLGIAGNVHLYRPETFPPLGSDVTGFFGPDYPGTCPAL